MSQPCTMRDPQVRQCCCHCRYHLVDYQHCCTNPQLRQETGRCICDTIKGYICAPPEFEGKACSDWPNHSVGCEMYQQRTAT